MSQQLSPMLGTRTEVRSRRGAVSAGHPLAVRAGLSALAEGGSAIDAAVAAGFAAFVAEPNNAGIGGYGHLSAFLAGERRFFTVDHGPRAPQAAHAGHVRGARRGRARRPRLACGARRSQRRRTLAPAVPGAVAGLWAAHRAAGRLPWARLLEPAIELAARGLEVTWPLLLEIAARAAGDPHLPGAGSDPVAIRATAKGAYRRRRPESDSIKATWRIPCG